MNRLRVLLGPKPAHPWGALIPQVLLWCFRRFCVEKLLLLDDATSALLSEEMWDDYFELIQCYAPKGMEAIASTWLKVEHLEELHSSLEDYNSFFRECLELIDEAVATDNDVFQNAVSEFLDDEIRAIFMEWLTGAERVFLIFPRTEKEDDEFTDAQYMALIHSLLNYSKINKAVSLTTPPAVPVVYIPEPVAAVAAAAAEPAAPAEEAPAPSEPPAEPPAVEAPAPTEPPAEPPAAPVAAALAKRRQTFRRHGRRANRGSTLRVHRHRNKTRRAAGSLFPVSNESV